jgi:hypothetical protein
MKRLPLLAMADANLLSSKVSANNHCDSKEGY